MDFAAGTPLVELRSVTKTYGQGSSAVNALNEINLSIEEEDFIAIMGSSGSGKSTLLNILGCLDSPTSGDHLLQGVEVGRLTSSQRTLIRRNVLGFIFQGFNLLPRTTALENVELPLIYRGVSASERRETAARCLAQVGLGRREGHTPAELSGGQQQRVAIARAIVTEPKILLADEPTGNLDTRTSREIMELLVGLNASQGTTVIVVTHEPDIAAYARRIIRFVDGRIESDVPNRQLSRCR